MSQYFDLMNETSQATDHLIARYMEDVSPDVRHLPMKRHGNPRLRDLQIRTGHEINGGENWPEILPVCASLEILNCSTYVINWFLDEKNGYESIESKRGLVIGGFQLREIAQKILEGYNLESVIPTLRDINHQVYLGQEMDIQELQISKLDRYPNYDKFLEQYQERCRLLSGVFYGSCFLAGSIVAGAPDKTLYKMGDVYGAATQAANDFGDFAVPVQGMEKLEKPYQDQLSDFVNGKLTLAVYLLNERANDAERRKIEELRHTTIVTIQG